MEFMSRGFTALGDVLFAGQRTGIRDDWPTASQKHRSSGLPQHEGEGLGDRRTVLFSVSPPVQRLVADWSEVQQGGARNQ